MLMKSLLVVVLLSSVLACGSESMSLEDPGQGGKQEGGQGDDLGDGNDGDMQEVQITFIEDILPIIENRCSLCHSEASGLPFWEDYDTLFEKQDRVRARVFEFQDMPRGNATGMTQEERQLVADWIDQGAVFE